MLYSCVHAQWSSHVYLFATPQAAVLQAPLSMGFPRQEYWNGLPFPTPGDLPNPGIEPVSPALAGEFFTTEPVEKFLLYSELPPNTSFFINTTHPHWIFGSQP